MRTTSVVVTMVSLAAGGIGAVWAYDAASPPAPTVAPVSDTSVPKAVAKRPRLVWAPCRPPATLRHGECVTDVVHTVVLPPVAPPLAPPVVAAAPAAESEDQAEHEAAEPPEQEPAEHEQEHEAEEPEHEQEHEDDGATPRAPVSP
ncbi:hypothetical protein EKO23_12640 [Nocardioides guangzhouensis]|uniref:Uncharacterized protein n=1 Tax=Nocardioides guangzhouensis TaxID=2497878 RepID=A0A4Q4ZDA4_9ACTN|nr:hypothetical protein [Nocardioides guangzhouensis]RYP85326.1 hypothetical protein EKO23_12640 [Nocardioides guangzhouensis]